MSRRANLIGQRFGRVVVVAMDRMTKSGAIWHCQCDCGGTAEYRTGALKAVVSPGCADCEFARRGEIHRTHGDSPIAGKAKLYMIWKGMQSRCRDVGNTSYAYYGARGISVCQEWGSYATFREWAELSGYEPGLSIERRDSSLDYSPANCEWITRGENSRRALESYWEMKRAA